MSISIPQADFTPQLAGYTGQGAFRFWCQKVLPIVYDDSLSYYELLNKIVVYLNNVISDVATVEDNVAGLYSAYDNLQDYVNEKTQEIVGVVNQFTDYINSYFDNLDVQEEIDEKLDVMASDGTLSNLLIPIMAEAAPDIISAWLEHHITPTTPIVDDTLTISGAAADAEKTGEIRESLIDVALVPELRNGSAGNSGNANAITQVTVIPTITSNGIWVYLDIPLANGEYFHVNLDGYNTVDIPTSNSYNKVYSFDGYVKPHDSMFYVDFTVLPVETIESVALSIFKKDSVGTNIPLRIENVGNAMRIRYDNNTIGIDNNLYYIKNSVDGLQTFDMYSDFCRGSLVNGVPSDANYRVYSKSVIKVNKAITVTAKPGYKFGVQYFSSGSFSSDSGWKTTYDIAANAEFKIVVARLTEETTVEIPISDIYTFARNVSFTIHGEVYEIKNALKQVAYTPILRNGSAANAGNAYGITEVDVIPLNGARGFWVSLNIPLNSGERFHINLDAYSAIGIPTTNQTYKIYAYDGVVKTENKEFYIDFSVFPLTNLRSVALSVFKIDSTNANVALRVENLGNAISIRFDNETIYDANNFVYVKNASSGLQTFDMYSDFCRGGLTNGTPTTLSFRVYSESIVTFDKTVYIKAKAGYKFGVHTFVNGEFSSDSGWKTEMMVPANTEFRIVVAKRDESTPFVIDLSEIYDFARNVVFSFTTSSTSFSVPWEIDMHRGYSSATVHENTVAAFYRAWLNGATMIEVDARLTSDGKYVSNHDDTVTVNGVTYTIASETSETLTHLVLSHDDIYGDCCIPLLETVLNLCCYTGMKANVDCKAIDPATLAKLVIDCNMSGRVMYANTTIEDALAILAVDPNAGFIFAYEPSNLLAWFSALTDYHTRQRSFAWSPNVSYGAIEATRSKGFKYLLSGVSTTTDMHFAPDCVEFISTADCRALTNDYIDSLDFGV